MTKEKKIIKLKRITLIPVITILITSALIGCAKLKATGNEITSETAKSTTEIMTKAAVEKIIKLETSDGEEIVVDTNNTTSTVAGDGSVTYTLSDNTQVIVSTNGETTVKTSDGETTSAKITETVTASNDANTNKTITVVTDANGETKTAVTETPTETPTEAPKPEPVPVPAPIETPTEPPAPMPVPTEAPIVCSHPNTHNAVLIQATPNSNGSYGDICDNCGATLNTYSIHAYSTYPVDLGGGNSTVVYGYYDYAMADEINRQLNEYRASKGLITLTRNLDTCSKIRAYELGYSYSHTRPNGTDCSAINENVAGEIIAGADFTDAFNGSASGFMRSWKDSTPHDVVMRNQDIQTTGVAVFVDISLDNNGIPIVIYYYAIQNFGY